MIADIINEFSADFGSNLKDDLGRRDLAFLRSVAKTAEGTELAEAAAHVYHAARKGVMAAQGTERQDWSWAFKGVALVCPETGEELESWPKSEDSAWLRPTQLLAALAKHRKGVLVWAAD